MDAPEASGPDLDIPSRSDSASSIVSLRGQLADLQAEVQNLLRASATHTLVVAEQRTQISQLQATCEEQRDELDHMRSRLARLEDIWLQIRGYLHF